VRNTPRILAAIGAVLIAVIFWRIITGGPIGPKTYALIGVTVAVWAGVAVTMMRAPRATIPPRV
jgi:membrane protein required for beta-lactamase induction